MLTGTITKFIEDCNGSGSRGVKKAQDFIRLKPKKVEMVASVDNDLQVFPNPTSGNVTVSSIAFNIKTISIIDIFGRTVIEKQADGANNVQLDLSKEAKGVYIIKTISNSGILNVQKIVVN